MSTQRTPPPPHLAGEVASEAKREGARARGRTRILSQEKLNWHIDEDMHARAKELRSNSTDAEKIIWYGLRAHRLNGARFRRQTPIAPYIVDFVCHAEKLVIEIDGGQHFEVQNQKRDARRDAFLTARGFYVLRFNNRDVMTNRQGVLETIADAVARAPSRFASLATSPASGGGGVRGSGGVSS